MQIYAHLELKRIIRLSKTLCYQFQRYMATSNWNFNPWMPVYNLRCFCFIELYTCLPNFGSLLSNFSQVCFSIYILESLLRTVRVLNFPLLLIEWFYGVQYLKFCKIVLANAFLNFFDSKNFFVSNLWTKVLFFTLFRRIATQFYA